MEMDYSLLDMEPSVDAPITEPSVVVSSSPATEPAVEPVSSPVSEAPQAPQPSASTTPVDDFDDTTPLTPRERILMERLDKITGDNLSLTTTEPKVAPPATSAAVARNFMEGLDINDVLATSENLNTLLATVYNEAMTEASKLSAEQILQNLPNIMSTYVTQHLTMNKLVEDFYTSNPDLQPVKQTVATVANKIAAEHPEFTTEQVFEASATETRSLLRIKGLAAAPTTPARGTKPAFAPATNGRVRERAPVLTGIEKDVLDLIT